VVELSTAVLFALQAAVHLPDVPLVVSRLILSAILVTLFWTDLETQRLPNLFTIPGVVVGLVSSAFVPPGLTAGIVGTMLGGGVLLALRWAWLRATEVEGMGLGDVKMLAMIGAFLGWQQVILVLFFASVSGALAGIALVIAGGRTMQASLPFGTFLAVAALVASFVGPDLFAWYLSTLP
jgi:leader peptidase (prepilin peptidase)/N-methyltransferase